MAILGWLSSLLRGKHKQTTPEAVRDDPTPKPPRSSEAVHVEFGRTVKGKAPDGTAAAIQRATPIGRVTVSFGVETPKRPLDDHAGFDAFMDKRAEELEGSWFYSSLAGTSHRNDDGTSRQGFIRKLRPLEKLECIPEPENKFHAEAIRVETSDGAQVGFLHRKVAEEATRDFKRGDRFEAYVAKVHGEGADLRNVRLGLLRWSPAQLARPQEERDFEKWVAELARSVGSNWFYARIGGLKAKNEDGSDRRELLLALPHRHQFNIVADTDDAETATRIHLLDPERRIVGILEKQQSKRILNEVARGFRWVAVLRSCTESGGKFQAFVALFRVKEG